MTMTETHSPPLADETAAGRVIHSVTDWLTTAQHRAVGRLYAGFALLAGLGAAVIGLLLAIERTTNDSGTVILDATSTYQLSTLLRIALPYLVVAPLMLGIALAVVPHQIGSRAVAFPRAAALSFWMWLGGAVLLICGYGDNGGIGGLGKGVSLAVLGLGLSVVGLLLGSVCLAATVMTLRAPGMTLDRVPMFTWASFVMATFAVISLPVLLANLIHFYVAYRYGKPLGESPVLMTHISWAVSHPGTALFALPALGFIADVFPTMARARQPLRPVLLGAIGLAGMLAVGSDVQRGVFADVVFKPLFVISCLAAVLPVFLVMASSAFVVKSARPKLASPLVFAVLAGLVLLLGSAAAVLLPWRGLRQYRPEAAADTVYLSGQANLVLLASLLAGLGAIVYWAPRMWGRVIDDKKVLPLALLGALGAVLVGVPELISGLFDQPIDQVNFAVDGPAELLNALVVAGWGLVFLSIVATAGLIALSLRSGAVDANPWDGQTLEWTEPAADLWVGSAEPLADTLVTDRKEG